jgi:rare lipoprotein A (peptidoglycan hydrolase)
MEREYTRREFLEGVVKAAGVYVGVKNKQLITGIERIDGLADYIEWKPEEIKRRVLAEAARMGGSENLGYRLTDPWRSKKTGHWLVAYQNVVLKMSNDGKVGVSNMPNILAPATDQLLTRGELGVLIPPRRYGQKTVDSRVKRYVNRLKSMGIDIGNACSNTSRVNDYLQVTRYENSAVYLWDNKTINLAPVGAMVIRAGKPLVPKEVILNVPQYDCDISGRLEKTDDVIVGNGSFYSEKKGECLGCGAERIMANTEEFNHARRTVAVDESRRGWLGSKALIEPLDVPNCSTVVEVTDTGDLKKYDENRVVDMTVATIMDFGANGFGLINVKVTRLQTVLS